MNQEKPSFHYTSNIKPRCFNKIPISEARSKYDPTGISKYIKNNFTDAYDIDAPLPKSLDGSKEIEEFNLFIAKIINAPRNRFLHVVFTALALLHESWLPEMIQYGVLALFGIKRTRGQGNFNDKSLQNVLYTIAYTCKGVSILEIMGEISILKYICIPADLIIFEKAQHVTFTILSKLVQRWKNDEPAENSISVVNLRKLLDELVRENSEDSKKRKIDEQTVESNKKVRTTEVVLSIV